MRTSKVPRITSSEESSMRSGCSLQILREAYTTLPLDFKGRCRPTGTAALARGSADRACFCRSVRSSLRSGAERNAAALLPSNRQDEDDRDCEQHSRDDPDVLL